MIVCTNCGNHNEDTDEFCGSCGKFLEWVGERVEAPAVAAEPEIEEEADPVKVGFVDRVKAAVGIDEASRPVDAPVAVGVGAAGAGSLAADPDTEIDADAELQRAAEEAAAAESARQESEAAEAARRAQVAQEEAQARAEAEAEAARAAEDEARRQRAAEAEAVAEAVRMRRQQEEAEAKQRDEELARATAEAASTAADEAARAAAEEQARAEAEADRLRQQQTEAEQQAQREASERAAAEADRLRQEQAEKAAALEAAKRAEEAAKEAAESEAAARAEAEAKARAESEAAKAADEEARRRAEDEARAVAAAEARAREEEEARKRAAALLARPKAPVTPPPSATPSGADPFVGDPATTEAGAASATAMNPAAAAAAAAAHAQKPTAQTPVAQQPTTIKQPPRPDPKVTAVEQAIQPGDLVCSQCGSGNDPARKFCRKCGNSLAQAVVAAKVPWWKRIFGGKKAGGGRVSKDAREKQRRKQKATDASFKAQMAMANLKKAAMFLMMIGVLGAFAIPSVRGEAMRFGRDGFTSVQDMFNPKISPVNAIAVAATSQVPTKEANLAADLVVNTYWAEGAEGDGVGQTITFTFAEPTDLTKVLITAGSTNEPDNYLNNPRPKGLHLVFDTGGSADLNLIDAEFRKSQSFGLKGAKGVTKVDIVISSVYPGRGGTETGIAEVEFKKKG